MPTNISCKACHLSPGKCTDDDANNIDIDADCSSVFGKLTLCLSDMVHVTDARNRMMKMIKDMMDAKLLDKCHPAILRAKLIWSLLSQFQTMETEPCGCLPLLES